MKTKKMFKFIGYSDVGNELKKEYTLKLDKERYLCFLQIRDVNEFEEVKEECMNLLSFLKEFNGDSIIHIKDSAYPKDEYIGSITNFFKFVKNAKDSLMEYYYFMIPIKKIFLGFEFYTTKLERLHYLKIEI